MTPAKRSNGNRFDDDALLDAARTVFESNGFGAASMDAIADRANTTKPTLYARFGNKADLYERCIEREANRLREWLLAAYDTASSLDTEGEIREDMLAFFRYATAQPSGFRLLLGEWSESSHSSMRERLLQALTDRIAERIRANHARQGYPEPPVGSAFVAGMVVAIAVDCGRRMLQLDLPPEVVGGVAAAFVSAGLLHLQSELFRHERRRPAT